MNPSAGLVTALNKMRELSISEGNAYHQYFPIVDSNTNIGDFGEPMFGDNYQAAQEAFFGMLKRIAYAATETKLFNNPLAKLEGDNIPLGWAGEEIHVNPVHGRAFDVNDFAGILQKYEADIKVQYLTVNMDVQYPVTLTREKIRTAFTSWRDLEEFITGIINALYNGAYINMYQFTKALVSAAYKDNKAQVEVVSAVTNEATGKALIKKLRELYTRFQLPSSEFNAWAKVGGEGRPITTWSAPEDIVLLLRADIVAAVDVDVLAAAFNMDKADFLGALTVVDNFDVYADDGTKQFDGSAIYGILADKSFFKIKTQDMALDQWYNPNNRSWQYYLNVVKMYNYSLFANGVIIATSAPVVDVTKIEAEKSSVSVEEGSSVKLQLTTTPFTGNPTITASSSAEGKATASVSGKVLTINGVDDGSATITVTATNSDTTTTTCTVSVTVTAAAS